jgi:hypothetical protein
MAAVVAKPEQKEPAKKLNLYQKIVRLQWEAVEIKKSGKNEFAKYPYKKWTDIKAAIDSKMLELGLCLVPEEMPIADMNLSLGNVGKASTVTYNQKWSLVNSDNPSERQTFIFPVIGLNNDGHDKAHGSGITYTEKYLFNMLGLLPDESLDPDDNIRNVEVQPKPKRASKGKSEFQSFVVGGENPISSNWDPNYPSFEAEMNSFGTPEVKVQNTPKKAVETPSSTKKVNRGKFIELMADLGTTATMEGIKDMTDDELLGWYREISQGGNN